MRRLIFAAAAIAAFATAGALATTAQAMPLSGMSAQTESSVVPVYTKCRWFTDYNGYRYQKCWEVPDYYSAPVYVPRRYYGGGGYGYGSY